MKINKKRLQVTWYLQTFCGDKETLLEYLSAILAIIKEITRNKNKK
jgi:hypothetical protein